MSYKVTVITVCKNASSTISLTLRSVNDQQYPNIEHLIIDGNSSDGTQELVQQQSHSNTILVSEPDKGIYDAMAKGVERSTGDILFFLNSGDVFFEETTISKVIDYFQESNVDIVFGNLLPVLLNKDDVYSHCFKPDEPLDQSYIQNKYDLLTVNIHHQTIFYKKEIFKNCGFFSIGYEKGTDWGLHADAILGHNHTFAHIPLNISKFALGGVSTSNFEKELEACNKIMSLINKRYSKNNLDYVVYRLNKKIKSLLYKFGEK